MKIPIFLSYPKPYNKEQEGFVTIIKEYLISREFDPRTLGVTDYGISAPLNTIRSTMIESNGLITIAFRRYFIADGSCKPNTNSSSTLKNIWMTSPYSHIEPAMAYQIGLPVLILRESGVMDDGILEKGVLGLYMPEFDLSNSGSSYLDSIEWKNLITKWECMVHRVVENKGTPPKLY